MVCKSSLFRLISIKSVCFFVVFFVFFFVCLFLFVNSRTYGHNRCFWYIDMHIVRYAPTLKIGPTTLEFSF